MNPEHTRSVQPDLKAPGLDPDNSRLEALEISEIRYRRLFEAARDGILIMDAETSKITDSNPFMTELLGYSREELCGKRLSDIGWAKDKEAAGAALAQLHRASYVRYDDLPLETKSHESRDGEVVGNIYPENGVNVIQFNIRDNTERKRLQKTALEASQRAQALIESNISGIMLCELQGRIFNVNDTLLEMLGYTQEEVTGGHLLWNEIALLQYAVRDALAVEELDHTGRCKPFQCVAFAYRTNRVAPMRILIGASVAIRDNRGGIWACKS